MVRGLEATPPVPIRTSMLLEVLFDSKIGMMCVGFGKSIIHEGDIFPRSPYSGNRVLAKEYE
jgi:hypothetical protein